MTEHVIPEPAGVAARVVSDELVEAVMADAAGGCFYLFSKSVLGCWGL